MKKLIVPAVVAKAIKNVARERYDVTDAGQPGLVLRVTENAASWVVRTKVSGRSIRIVLGPAREIDLSLARRLTQAAVDHLRSGREVDAAWIDARLVEAGVREPHRAPPEPEPVKTLWTWDEAVDAYLVEAKGTVRPKTLQDYGFILRGPHLKILSGRRVEDLDRQELARLVRAVHATGVERSAERVAETLRPMWTFLGQVSIRSKSGVEEGVMAGLRAPRRSRDAKKTRRLPTVDALARVIAVCRADVYHPTIGLALELLVLTAQRRLTIASASVADLEFDMPPPLWAVDGGLMKGGLPHYLPATPRIVELFETARERAGGSVYLFPQIRPGKTGGMVSHISEHNLTAAMVNLPGIDASPHDVRRTFSTAVKARPRGQVREPALILDHREGRHTTTDVHYDRHDYAEEKIDMLTFWEGLLEEAVADVVLDLDEIHAGIRAAHAHRNRNRRKTPVDIPEDAPITPLEVVEEWARGAMETRRAVDLAEVAGVADLRRIAAAGGIEVRRQ